ncbi:MAG: hydratase [Bacillota bacterium]|jgi:aconitate hydratase
MVELLGKNGVYLIRGVGIIEDTGELTGEEVNRRLRSEGRKVDLSDLDREKARANTITGRILAKHNTTSDPRNLKIKFDALASHDITYVGIIQTARASGLREFPVPYVLTNCHNSLCAVGGTINEDDHVFGLSAAQKYGGIFVPAHQAVIHQYMREMMTGCGKMLLGSDSHTRYGPLGTMGVGEGGPELVKQLLGRTYDLVYPGVVAVYLEGRPMPGVGPQDVALAIIKAVFANGFVKNKVMEFVGPGVENLSVDYRNGIDVMTTETTCLSSIWRTDAKVAEYYRIHGRAEAYLQLEPGPVSYYDGLVKVNLSKVEAMIALPFHPSNVYTINEFNANAAEILRLTEDEARRQLDNPKLEYKLTNKLVNGRLRVDQGVVAGCSGGTFENLVEVADIIGNASLGAGEFALSIYPASQPINLQLVNTGVAARLMTAGAIWRTAFCGPCFGAGDVPANAGLSIRHTTRNFPNREGSKPAGGQVASVALMDARSIAATAVNGGYLTPATALPKTVSRVAYTFNKKVYDHRVYYGVDKPQPEIPLKFGPNIVDWPALSALTENLLLAVVAVIHDPVTTTDELIPSGETSSYRSNPLKLAEFTLSRKEPEYVGRAKRVQQLEQERQRLLPAGFGGASDELRQLLAVTGAVAPDRMAATTGIGSVIFAMRPGDGSAREQAASCQKVLGGWANLAVEYATKRYRSNLINWGMLPFTIEAAEAPKITLNSVIFIPGIRQAVQTGAETVTATVVDVAGRRSTIRLKLANLSPDERAIILAGSLINYYAH